MAGPGHESGLIKSKTYSRTLLSLECCVLMIESLRLPWVVSLDPEGRKRGTFQLSQENGMDRASLGLPLRRPSLEKNNLGGVSGHIQSTGLGKWETAK